LNFSPRETRFIIAKNENPALAPDFLFFAPRFPLPFASAAPRQRRSSVVEASLRTHMTKSENFCDGYARSPNKKIQARA
jgi:hypothetical protein